MAPCHDDYGPSRSHHACQLTNELIQDTGKNSRKTLKFTSRSILYGENNSNCPRLGWDSVVPPLGLDWNYSTFPILYTTTYILTGLNIVPVVWVWQYSIWKVKKCLSNSWTQLQHFFLWTQLQHFSGNHLLMSADYRCPVEGQSHVLWGFVLHHCNKLIWRFSQMDAWQPIPAVTQLVDNKSRNVLYLMLNKKNRLPFFCLACARHSPWTIQDQTAHHETVAREHQQLGEKPAPPNRVESIILESLWIYSYFTAQNQFARQAEVAASTWSDNPCAAARAFPLSAWTGLNVMPLHCAPYFLAKYLELPPIPHPTSTNVLGFFSGSSARQEVEKTWKSWSLQCTRLSR